MSYFLFRYIYIYIYIYNTPLCLIIQTEFLQKKSCLCVFKKMYKICTIFLVLGRYFIKQPLCFSFYNEILHKILFKNLKSLIHIEIGCTKSAMYPGAGTRIIIKTCVNIIIPLRTRVPTIHGCTVT